jgi:site-specific DNA-methyltransferase (cytosine-N4-specific)
VSAFYSDGRVELRLGDALSELRTVADGSVNCCVTSPPYFGLRDYGVEGQYGLEASPAEYVETMRSVFAEVRRALSDAGTLWLNIGDSYYSGRGNPGPNSADEKQPARRGWVRPQDKCGADWAKPKDLLGIPWRVAFALQDDGWILRNAIIWHKPNAMPESVRDRLSKRYEMVFLFSKTGRYYFDLDAIREEPLTAPRKAPRKTDEAWNAGTGLAPHRGGRGSHANGKNPGDVWSIPTRRFAEAHFATYPKALAERCVIAGCPVDGVVLDPFNGSGTTGAVALEKGRRYVGIDLSEKYLNLSLRTRLADYVGTPAVTGGDDASKSDFWERLAAVRAEGAA